MDDELTVNDLCAVWWELKQLSKSPALTKTAGEVNQNVNMLVLDVEKKISERLLRDTLANYEKIKLREQRFGFSEEHVFGVQGTPMEHRVIRTVNDEPVVMTIPGDEDEAVFYWFEESALYHTNSTCAATELLDGQLHRGQWEEVNKVLPPKWHGIERIPCAACVRL